MRCRACDAPIMWARSAATGKAMPLNPSPRTDGNVRVLAGVAYVLGSDEDRDLARAQDVPLYLSHFATCPSAGRFRR